MCSHTRKKATIFYFVKMPAFASRGVSPDPSVLYQRRPENGIIIRHENEFIYGI